MTTDTQTAADTAIARLAMIGEREDLKALSDDMLIGRWLGKGSLTLGDARAVAAWAREMGKPVPPVAAVVAHPMTAEPKDYEWNAARERAERDILSNDVRVVFLVGAGGSGKTRLVRELLRVADEVGSAACVLPSEIEAFEYGRRFEMAGASDVDFVSSKLLRSRTYRTVFLENFDFFDGDTASLLADAMKLTENYTIGTVVVAVRNVCLAARFYAGLKQASFIHLASPTALAEAA